MNKANGLRDELIVALTILRDMMCMPILLIIKFVHSTFRKVYKTIKRK